MSKEPTVEDLEQFCDKLHGPMGDMFHALYEVMGRRLRDREDRGESLTSQGMLDEFDAALVEIAPSALPKADPAELHTAIRTVLASAKMESAANSPSSDAVN